MRRSRTWLEAEAQCGQGVRRGMTGQLRMHNTGPPLILLPEFLRRAAHNKGKASCYYRQQNRRQDKRP